MIKFTRQWYSALSRTRDAVKRTTKDITKDVQRTATIANETLQDDFRAVAHAVADTSDSIDKKVRGTDKERFHAAEEAGRRAEQEERTFIFGEHAENPINKAAKMAHETKESIKNKVESASEFTKNAKDSAMDATKSAAQKAKDSAMRAAHSAEGYSEPRDSMTEKMTESVIGKVEDTVNTVKETITGATSKPDASKTAASSAEKVNPDNNPIPAASINPMGDTPNRDPVLKPQKPLSKDTEELQKEGAKRKADEDSFNLM